MEIRTDEMWYESRDRETKLYAKRWFPEGRPEAILQIVHGMSECVERYDEYARWMAQRGLLVIGNDHLGHGKSCPEGGTWGYFCKRDPATVLVRDVHRLKKLVQEEYPGVPIFIMGHSLGAIIAREYISRYGTGIQGAILQATGMQDARRIRAAMALARPMILVQGEKHHSKFIEGLIFRNYNDRIPREERTRSSWLSHNAEELASHAGDPSFGFTFTLNGFMALGELTLRTQDEDDMYNIPKDLPILILCGKEDPTGDYGAGADRLYKEYRDFCHIKDVTLKLYDGMRHELHHELDRRRVFEDELEFIHRVIADSGKARE